MSSEIFDRKSIRDKIGLLGRDNGNLNVLLVHAIAQHVGLSATEFECCSLIQDEGPFTAGELARRCRITTGGMTGIIDHLVKAGFAERKVDPRDRRKVLVYGVNNNKEAVAKVTSLYAPLVVGFEALLDTFDDKELLAILRFFDGSNKIFRETLEAVPEAK